MRSLAIVLHQTGFLGGIILISAITSPIDPDQTLPRAL
jgi:hypothetical protein